MDIYSCDAGDTGAAQVTLRSLAFDAAVIVGVETSSGDIETVAFDDNSAGGTDAQAAFRASKGSHYFVAVTNATQGPVTGPYTLTFSGALKNARPETGDTAQVRTTALRVQRLKPALKNSRE